MNRRKTPLREAKTRVLLLLCLLLGGCQWIYQPKIEPRYRWVELRQGGYWIADKAGHYYWNGKDYKHIEGER